MERYVEVVPEWREKLGLNQKDADELLMPMYETRMSAGCDFKCAEEVVVPSIWKAVGQVLVSDMRGFVNNWVARITGKELTEEQKITAKKFEPTLVHTGLRARIMEDDVLEIYNRSSQPKNLGLVLANGVGVIDSDYYNNIDTKGEIMFAYYNFMPFDVRIELGQRIGQGVIKKFYRFVNVQVKDVERTGGIGSTGIN